jgi:hypothetical protein
MSLNSANKIVRIAEADESTPRIDFAYIDKKYKEWLVRRGFASEEQTELGMRRSNGRRGRAVKRINSDESI